MCSECEVGDCGGEEGEEGEGEEGEEGGECPRKTRTPHLGCGEIANNYQEQPEANKNTQKTRKHPFTNPRLLIVR
jgi:hypothetical protein